ncbi:hypothetical protein [Natronomonas sp. EA1]|uniref:hypothetical protein n=1 Tax=Natronomonas sp. EA1 TaxID=3421655 RepID=UPI003EBE0391
MSDPFGLGLLVAAFAGGAFGASLGALTSFVFTGLFVIVGETYRLVQRNLVPGVATYGHLGLVDNIAFGVVFGPHVAFGGGAAALAYAVKKGYVTGTGGYHPAKNVTRGLGTRPDVLLVGGAFGVFGHLVAATSVTLALPWDPVAMGVVVSALAHRAVFGYDLIGATRDRFDMSPFEDAIPDGGRPAVEPWLPYQYRWPGVFTIGVVVGILGAYVAYLTASAFLAFGISVTLLVFVVTGVEEVPVTHHISLPASTAVIASAPVSYAEATPEALAATVSLPEALAVGAVFGVVGALAGEVLQRVLYAHADTHLDPPAASIVVTSFLIAVLAITGVFDGAVWVPTP